MNCPHCQAYNPDDARFCASCGKATSATEPVSHPGSAFHAAQSDLSGKEIAGRYRVLAKLGEGGMGAVYRAEQMSLKRTCAIKLLHSEVASTAVMLRRFEAEAALVAKLSHPNIVTIYDYGQDADGTFFIAMEFVDGRSLRQLIHSDAPLAMRRALEIAAQVAAALVEAHSQGIIHRDLKPDNVMLQARGRDRDVVRVLDFGIAKLRDEGRTTQAAMTQAGDMLGTPQYMAPEQIRAEPIDGRTDVYALGCMIYEMVTARLPFEAPTLMALLSKHLTENPPPPSQRRPELMIPPFLDELVMSALAKDPRARPPTMEAYGEKIAHALAALPPDTSAMGTATPIPTGRAAAPPSRFTPHTPPPTGPAANMGPPQMPTPGAAPQMQYGTPPQPPNPYQQNPMGHGAPPTQPIQQPMQPMHPMQQMQPTQPVLPQAPYGYGTPQAAYSPYATQGGAGKGFPIAAIIAIAVVLLGGAGAAIFFATRGGSTPTKDAREAIEDRDKNDKNDKNPDDKNDKNDGDDDNLDKTDGDDDVKNADPWSDSGAIMKQLETLKDKACACHDAACIGRVSKQYEKFATELQNNMAKLSKDPQLAVRMAEIAQELATCMANAGGTGITPQPPPSGDVNDLIDDIADRTCACTDKACARKMMREFADFVRRNKYNTSGDAERGRKSGERFGLCVVKAGVSATELQSWLKSIQ